MTYLHNIPWGPSTPGTPEQLNAIALFKRPNLSELAAVDDSDFPTYASDAAIAFLIPGWGLFSWKSGQALTEDGENVVNTASNQFVLEFQTAASQASLDLAPDVQDSVPAVTGTVDFASMATLTGASSSGIAVPGARANDFVLVQPLTALTNGVKVSGYVSAKNVVTLQAFNGTGSTQDPTSNDFRILVMTPYRVPPLTATAITIYEALLNGDYSHTTLEALLADPIQLAHFYILLASRRRMQNLQNDSTARSAISGSTTANAIMEAYDGVGW